MREAAKTRAQLRHAQFLVDAEGLGQPHFRIIRDAAGHSFPEQGHHRSLSTNAPALDRRWAVFGDRLTLGLFNSLSRGLLSFQLIAVPPRAQTAFDRLFCVHFGAICFCAHPRYLICLCGRSKLNSTREQNIAEKT